MNARVVSAAADLICRSMKTKQTPTGIAADLYAAGMLQSPEAAVDLEVLRIRNAAGERRRCRLVRSTAGLRARVAELTVLLEQAHAEARTALSGADEYPPALPWARLMDAEDRADFLDELAASAITHADSKTALAEVEDTCGRWRAIAEAQHAHNTAPGPNAQEPEHAAPCRWPASPDCTCAGPVPYALTTQATAALAPSPKAGA